MTFKTLFIESKPIGIMNIVDQVKMITWIIDQKMKLNSGQKILWFNWKIFTKNKVLEKEDLLNKKKNIKQISDAFVAKNSNKPSYKNVRFAKLLNEKIYLFWSGEFDPKEIMKSNNKTVLFGLGVDDPKGIFDTTKDLKKIYGNERVFDMPASENAADRSSNWNEFKQNDTHNESPKNGFFLLAMDQLINSKQNGSTCSVDSKKHQL